MEMIEAEIKGRDIVLKNVLTNTSEVIGGWIDGYIKCVPEATCGRRVDAERFPFSSELRNVQVLVPMHDFNDKEEVINGR